MRIIKTSTGTLDIGHQGENLATRVVFPAKEWRTLFGNNGTFQLLAQRKNDESPYPVVLTIDGDNIYWDITSSDTATVGLGKCELQYYLGEILAKSEIWVTKTSEALGEAGEAPEPYQSWVDEVLEAGSIAELSAISAQHSADDAGAYAQQAQESAESIVNMTVSAEEASEINVEKTIDPITGYVNLNFEIPSGSTSVKVNGEVFDPVDKIVDIGTVIREHQSLSEYRKAADQDVIDNGKQDTIADLSEIRAGAALGSTAYQKPTNGIPKSDLSSDVQTSLDKADTALQEHQSLSAYRTAAEQDIIDASKQDKFIIKTTMDATPENNTIYYLGLQTAVSFTLPTNPSLNDHFRVVFYSGTVKTTVTITGSYIGSVVPNMNERVSCDFVYDGIAWSVVSENISTYVTGGYCGDPAVSGGKDVQWGITATNDLVIYGDGAMSTASGQPWASYKDSIKTITVDTGITIVSGQAFRNIRNATSVNLPDGLTAIGSGAFRECRSVASIAIPASVNSIASYVFYDCDALTSIVIPSGITQISGNCFRDCDNLATVTIPVSVTNIANDAFRDCAAITDVYYGGTQTEWQAITIGNNNTYLTNATIHYEA